MKALILFAASLVASAQAPGAVRYLSYGGAPTSGDCTLALAGARVGVDTSTTPDTVYDCIDGAWAKRGTILGPLSTANSIPYATGDNTIGETSKLTWNPTTSYLQINAGSFSFNKSLVPVTRVVSEFGATSLMGVMQLNGNDDYGLVFSSIGDNSFGVFNYFYKSRSIDGATAGAVQSGDSLGVLQFYGDTASGFNVGGVYQVVVDGTVTSTVPAKHVWSTGSTSDAMTLKDNGELWVVGKVVSSQATPANSSATCTAGSLWADASYVYACTAANTIKRAALSTF